MASNDKPPLRSATAIPAPPPHLPSKGGSYVISKPGAKPKRKQFTHQIGEIGHASLRAAVGRGAPDPGTPASTKTPETPTTRPSVKTTQTKED